MSAIVRLAKYQPTAELVDESTAGDTKAKFWRISLGDDWTVPVVELWRGTPKGTSCVVADGGRTSAVAQIESLLSEGQRVLAIDPFYVGESKIEDRGYLFALLVSSVGARPLGVQADQLQAVTRWADTKFGEPVHRHVAIGPRITLAALVAAATGDNDERRSNSSSTARSAAFAKSSKTIGRSTNIPSCSALAFSSFAISMT